MPNSTDAQRRRKQEAVQSAFASSLMLLLPAVLKLWLRSHYAVAGFWGAVLLILSLLELGMIVPVWILLKKRFEEIQGGEEDAAAQY